MRAGPGGANSGLPESQWACSLCTLHNASNSLRCAACMTPKPAQEGGAALAGDAADGAGKGGGKKGKKGKNKGITLRINGGDSLDYLDQFNDQTEGPAWGGR